MVPSKSKHVNHFYSLLEVMLSITMYKLWPTFATLIVLVTANPKYEDVYFFEIKTRSALSHAVARVFENNLTSGKIYLI